MFTKAAEYMKKGLSYPSNLMTAIAMVAMVFFAVGVTIDVSLRYIFGISIFGLWDLNRLAYAVIVWGPMAMAAFKGSHITLTFLLDKFPRLPRLGLELIISLVTSGILAMVSYRLFVNAIMLGQQQTSTAVLRLPYEPIGYFAAFACAVMALAFLTRFPETLGKIRGER
jgi:TRAP-type C4-dicarboxylate transport system permease small subunit